MTGNVAIELELDGREHTIVGFENHGGRTYLGARERPLGRVLRGHGNNGHDRGEGVHRGNVVGTYLHGPLLPKNAHFADWLVRRALGNRRTRAARGRVRTRRAPGGCPSSGGVNG